MSKPEKCLGCPLYGEEGPVWGTGSLQTQLVILGNASTRDDAEANAPLAGHGGQILNRTLQKVGISRAGSYTTNIVKCAVPFKLGVSGPPPAAVRHCKKAWLDDELALVKPKVVMAMGSESFDGLCAPKHVALVHVRQAAKKDPSYWLVGAPYHHPLGMVVVPTVHPNFIKYTGWALLPDFEHQIEKVAQVLREGAPHYTDLTFNYNPSTKEVVEYVNHMIAGGVGGCDIETPYRTQEEDETNPDEEVPVTLIGLAASPRDCMGIAPDQFELLTPLFTPVKSRLPVRLWCYGSQTEVHFLTRLFGQSDGIQWADAMFAYHLLWPAAKSKDLGTAMAAYTRWGYHKNLETRDPILYNTLDTVGCLEAGENMYTEMAFMPIPMTELFWSLNACVPDLLRWQHEGANYDQNRSDQFEIQAAKTLLQYEKFWDEKFPLISWSSPKQLMVMFEKLGFKIPLRQRIKKKDGIKVRTKTPSLDADALEEIAKKGSAVASLVLRMRSLRKSDDFCNLADRGRLRTRAKIHGQVGGRIQTVQVNIQQIPEEMLVDPKVEGSGMFPRETVIPEHEDDCIVAADFSQVEFWLYAYYTKCQKLLDVKDRGEYLYGSFYENIFNEPFFLPDLPRFKQNRDDKNTPPWKLLIAKSWPLGFIYGRGVPTTEGLPISPARAKVIFRDFHSAYPEIGQFHNRIMFEAKKQGFLQTPYGRMRRFPNPDAQRNDVLAFFGQTTACDLLINKVILGAGQAIAREFGPRSRLYFTVHDSGIFNIHNGRRDPQLGVQAVQFIKNWMESPIPQLEGFSIPAEVKIGPSWGKIMSAEKYLAKVTPSTT